jgi:hypothetical protein
MVWQLDENHASGFIAHPTKSGHLERRANNPNCIYPGEKVALLDTTFRTQQYRQFLPGWLGNKRFSEEQIRTMKDFIARRLAEGKG